MFRFFSSKFLFVNNKKYGIQNIKNSSAVQVSIKTLHAESSCSFVLKLRPNVFPGFSRTRNSRGIQVLPFLKQSPMSQPIRHFDFLLKPVHSSHHDKHLLALLYRQLDPTCSFIFTVSAVYNYRVNSVLSMNCVVEEG